MDGDVFITMRSDKLNMDKKHGKCVHIKCFGKGWMDGWRDGWHGQGTIIQ